MPSYFVIVHDINISVRKKIINRLGFYMNTLGVLLYNSFTKVSSYVNVILVEMNRKIRCIPVAAGFCQ